MRQVLALDFIDPMPLILRKPQPDLNAGWFRVW